MIIDESTNISSNRIINTYTITSLSNCFYISNIEVEARKLGVDKLADYAILIVEQITNRDLLKVVLFTTDTYTIQRAV